MDFYTAYYWQQGSERTSLLLQQTRLSKGAETVILGAVCTGEGGEDERDETQKESEGNGWYGNGGQSGTSALGKRLTDWFYEQVLPACANQPGEVLAGRFLGTRFRELSDIFQEERKRAGREASASGILCVGGKALLFYQGRQRIYLLNRRMGKPHAGLLFGQEKGGALLGEEVLWEPGACLLLGTEPFYQYLRQQMIADCLGRESVSGEEQAGRCLKELGEYARSRGGRDMGAVFVCAV